MGRQVDGNAVAGPQAVTGRGDAVVYPGQAPQQVIAAQTAIRGAVGRTTVKRQRNRTGKPTAPHVGKGRPRVTPPVVGTAATAAPRTPAPAAPKAPKVVHAGGGAAAPAHPKSFYGAMVNIFGKDQVDALVPAAQSMLSGQNLALTQAQQALGDATSTNIGQSKALTEALQARYSALLGNAAAGGAFGSQLAAGQQAATDQQVALAAKAKSDAAIAASAPQVSSMSQRFGGSVGAQALQAANSAGAAQVGGQNVSALGTAKTSNDNAKDYVASLGALSGSQQNAYAQQALGNQQAVNAQLQGKIAQNNAGYRASLLNLLGTQFGTPQQQQASDRAFGIDSTKAAAIARNAATAASIAPSTIGKNNATAAAATANAATNAKNAVTKTLTVDSLNKLRAAQIRQATAAIAKINAQIAGKIPVGGKASNPPDLGPVLRSGIVTTTDKKGATQAFQKVGAKQKAQEIVRAYASRGLTIAPGDALSIAKNYGYH